MIDLTRRFLLAAGGAALALPAASHAAAATSLATIAASRGLRFGTAIAWGAPGADRASLVNPPYARLVTDECALVVAENAMKWQALRPSPTRFAFGHVDALVDAATRRGLAIRWHNLLWAQPKWMPAWLNAYDFGARPAAEAARLLTMHIDTVIARYGARIDSYDVVNEAVRPADGGLYETSLSRAFGSTEAMVDAAFQAARAAAPRATLVYNDYMSWEPGNEAHRAGVLRLLEGFRRRGTPVDALGLQSHIVTQGVDVAATIGRQQGDWRRFLDAVTTMGYRLLITELDVRDTGLPADIATRDALIAAYTRGYLDVTLDYRQLRDVVSWGLSDRYSWIDRFDPRADGVRRRPTLYDDLFRAKPMREAVALALAAAPMR